MSESHSVSAACLRLLDDVIPREQIKKKRSWKQYASAHGETQNDTKRPKHLRDIKAIPPLESDPICNRTAGLVEAEREDDSFAEPGMTQIFQTVEASSAEEEQRNRIDILKDEFDDGADAVEELAANDSSFDITPSGLRKQALELSPRQTSNQHPIPSLVTGPIPRVDPYIQAQVKQCLQEMDYASSRLPQAPPTAVGLKQHAYKIEEMPISLSLTEDREMVLQKGKGGKEGSVKVLFRQRSVHIPDSCKVLRPKEGKRAQEAKKATPTGNEGYFDRWVQKSSFITDAAEEPRKEAR